MNTYRVRSGRIIHECLAMNRVGLYMKVRSGRVIHEHQQGEIRQDHT